MLRKIFASGLIIGLMLTFTACSDNKTNTGNNTSTDTAASTAAVTTSAVTTASAAADTTPPEVITTAPGESGADTDPFTS